MEVIIGKLIDIVGEIFPPKLNQVLTQKDFEKYVKTKPYQYSTWYNNYKYHTSASYSERRQQKISNNTNEKLTSIVRVLSLAALSKDPNLFGNISTKIRKEISFDSALETTIQKEAKKLKTKHGFPIPYSTDTMHPMVRAENELLVRKQFDYVIIADMVDYRSLTKSPIFRRTKKGSTAHAEITIELGKNKFIRSVYNKDHQDKSATDIFLNLDTSELIYEITTSNGPVYYSDLQTPKPQFDTVGLVKCKKLFAYKEHDKLPENCISLKKIHHKKKTIEISSFLMSGIYFFKNGTAQYGVINSIDYLSRNIEVNIYGKIHPSKQVLLSPDKFDP